MFCRPYFFSDISELLHSYLNSRDLFSESRYGIWPVVRVTCKLLTTADLCFRDVWYFCQRSDLLTLAFPKQGTNGRYRCNNGNKKHLQTCNYYLILKIKVFIVRNLVLLLFCFICLIRCISYTVESGAYPKGLSLIHI